ncbi:hypothetical protein [Thalassolituus maritimus]|uniref:Uncharacterized protein n=1 Tax=Thalassolituus maritimus TaxID=484498 RepID=A0ABQ0A2W5_9GAMM
MNIRNTLSVIAAASLLAACSDGGSSSNSDRILLTKLVDDIFMADENSEPVEIQNVEIIDNADEDSFTYLTGGE